MFCGQPDCRVWITQSYYSPGSSKKILYRRTGYFQELPHAIFKQLK